MTLDYLVFDWSDEESGRGTFDAMASVAAARVPAVLSEIATVLRWATERFGAAGALQDESDWDFALEATAEPDTSLAIAFDSAAGEVAIDMPAIEASRILTVTLTLTGSAAFCDAFRFQFEDTA